MSAVIIALVGLVCLVLGAVVTAAILRGPRQRSQSEPVDAALSEARGADPEAEPPQAIDPDNPPYYAVYNPRRYDPEKAVRCTCHHLPAAKGDTLLLWPIPGHPEGGMDVFCSRTYSIHQGR